MKINSFLFGLLIATLICGSIYAASGITADPTEIGVGARPLGLGKAFVGFSDDASVIFINPAGNAKVDGLKITSMSGQVLQDLNYLVFSAVQPYDFGTLGFGFVNVGLPGIPVTTVTGGGTIDVTGATEYGASVFLFSYSNDAKKIPLLGWMENTTCGMNVKYFTQGFSGGGASLEGANGSGFDMDIGLQHRPSKAWVLGLSVINALPETMGGRFTWVKNNVVEDIPTVLKIGTKVKISGAEDSIYEFPQDLYVGIDSDSSSAQNRPTVYHFGCEWWPSKIMALRLGMDQKPKGGVSGIGVDNNLTAGIGLKFDGFTFDYCYHQFSDLSENVTHFFSIGYIGNDKKQPKLVEEPRVILPIVVPKPNLKEFSDVPDGYWAKGPIEFMATLGVMDGYSDGSFKPEGTVTRAQLAKVLINLKEIEPNEVFDNPYPDVPRNNWAAKYIKAAFFLNFMGPYPDGNFKPDKLVTRAEGVIILTRFESIRPMKNIIRAPYPDVPKWHWAVGEITVAKSLGYLDYLPSDRNFDVDKLLTRSEVAEMLSKTEYGRKRIRKLLEE